MFSSLSNLNNHIRSAHDGILWICPYCEEEQSSKYSQKRHIARKHGTTFEGNLDCNKFQLKARMEMTPEAKDLFISKMTTTMVYNQDVIKNLKTKLKTALFKIAELEKVVKGQSEEKNGNILSTFYFSAHP